jgi:hypothetical protein
MTSYASDSEAEVVDDEAIAPEEAQPEALQRMGLQWQQVVCGRWR